MLHHSTKVLRFAYFPYIVTYVAPISTVGSVELVNHADVFIGLRGGANDEVMQNEGVNGARAFYSFPDLDFDFSDAVSSIVPASRSVATDTELKVLPGVKLPPGITVILGLSKSGKTWVASELVNELGLSYAHYGEPDFSPSHTAWAGVNTKMNARVHHGCFDTLVAHIINVLVSPKCPGMIIDSYVRNAYSRSGNLTRTGLNITALSELSGLSRAACMLKKRVVILLGLLDETIYDTAVHACTLSCESTVSLVREGVSRLVDFTVRTRSASYSALDGFKGSFTLPDPLNTAAAAPVAQAPPAVPGYVMAVSAPPNPSSRQRALLNLANTQKTKKGE